MTEVEEPELHRQAGRLRGSGAQILLLGGALAALGGLVYLLGTGTAAWVKALGAMLATLGAAPTLVGLVLLATSGVSSRASKHKPFA